MSVSTPGAALGFLASLLPLIRVRLRRVVGEYGIVAWAGKGALLAATLAVGVARADETVSVARLMSIGPLPDIVQGSASAPVTIVEYASMTCTHCQAFHATTWPKLKTKYVDTGRAKFILREFPLDPLAAAAFMLARCAGPGKRNPLIDRMFHEQNAWAFVRKPTEPLFAVVARAGYTRAAFDACLKDKALYDEVNASRDRAAKAFGIEATPTFFVNGHKLKGEAPLADFDRLIAASAR